jgi:WD40 repeat protein
MEVFQAPTAVNAAVLSKNGKAVIAATDSGALIAFDRARPEHLKRMGGHTKSVRDVAVSPHSSLMVSASWDSTLRLWTSMTESSVLSGHSDWVNACCFSPASDVIASASHDHTVKLWSADGRCTATLRGHDNWVLACAFAESGDQLVSGCFDGTVAIWDANRTHQLSSLRLHQKRVNGVAFANDDRVLLSISDDGSVIAFDVRANEVASKFFCRGGGTALSVAPDGRQFCVCDSLGNVHSLRVCV